MQGETSQWVPIDEIILHPDNPNKMTDDDLAKLSANIESNDGRYPPLIVRDLTRTVRFTDEQKQGKLQMLDGEHRYRLEKARGASHVHVMVWPGVSDDKAIQVLLTMNRIGGSDDKKKRAALIRRLAELEPDFEQLATVLPEGMEEIEKTVKEVARAAVENATAVAAAISTTEPLTIFVTPAQKEAINRGIMHAAQEIDPNISITDCREGAALKHIVEEWTERSV